jgi:hypothetical protein
VLASTDTEGRRRRCGSQVAAGLVEYLKNDRVRRPRTVVERVDLPTMLAGHLPDERRTAIAALAAKTGAAVFSTSSMIERCLMGSRIFWQEIPPLRAP